MCGISGIVSSGSPVSQRAVEPSLDAQQHRGPDASGSWADGVCALGLGDSKGPLAGLTT